MPGNSFGQAFKLTTFGESHGPAIGLIIDGCPSGLALDLEFLQSELNRRKPGQSHITTQRKESDTVEVLSGVFEGKTTGTPIGMIIPNEDQRSKDYSHIKDSYRPSHADYTYDLKYGVRDYRGGGRSSARETACRVAAGAVAKLLLRQTNTRVQAYVSRVASLQLEKHYQDLDLDQTESNIVRCPDAAIAQQMIDLIDEVRKEGDTIGGTITCVISNCPPALGEPVFDKLHADLAKAMLSINAAQGFEYGSGFQGTFMRGSQNNDSFFKDELTSRIRTRTNNSGGIQGGISNGEDIYFTVAFKPIATIIQAQDSVNALGDAVEVAGRGRHDPCVLPRAVPIVEAMAALVIADHLLRKKIYA